jgi:CheY-like chemotaxis protein
MTIPLSFDISSNRKKILIIEDNAETQLILKIYLRDFYDVDTVETGTEGLQKISKNGYSLIILDINLPGGVDGNDIIKKLKKDPKYKQLPILVVTAYALKGDKEKYLAMGANGYLTKPFNKNEIVKITQELVV